MGQVSRSGFRAEGLGFRVSGSESGFRVFFPLASDFPVWTTPRALTISEGSLEELTDLLSPCLPIPPPNLALALVRGRHPS
jgi:hypothetical protein